MPLQKSLSEQSHIRKRQNSQFPHNNRHTSTSQDAKPLKKTETSGDNSCITNAVATEGKLSGTRPEANSIQKDDLHNKENIGSYSNRPATNAIPLERSPGNESNVAARAVPTTPAGRLTLPDLIGMVDIRSAPKDDSPYERISWNHNATHDSPASQYGGSHRGVKRPRSASPTSSSPAQMSSNQFAHKEDVVDLKRLHLKTPRRDPGTELWESYYQNADKSIGLGVHNLEASDSMFMSSPQHLNSGLRRSISCGNHWPKRRKLDGQHVDVFTDPVDSGPSKLKLVSNLLEKVQENFTSSTKLKFQQSPIDSRLVNGASLKALGSESEVSVEENSGTDAEKPIVQFDKRPNRTEHCQPADALSDYGDIDDEAFIEALNDSEMRYSQHEVLDDTSTGGHKEVVKEEVRVRRGSSVIKESVLRGVTTEEEDEYGDMEDDLFTSDFGPATMCTKQVTRQPSEQVTQAPGVAKADRPTNRFMGSAAMAKSGSDDEYGSDFDGSDFEVAEIAAAAQSSKLSATEHLTPKRRAVRAIQRYFVNSVIIGEYTTNTDATKKEKIVLAQIESSKEIRTILLRDGWLDTPVSPKAFVHIIGNFVGTTCIIDDSQNMLILHPDHLISATVVADSFGCLRRAVLQDRVKATNESSPPLVYGTILHEIFQTAMMANRWDTEWLLEVIHAIATKHLEDLYTIRLQISQAVEHLRSKMVELQSWAELFVSSRPKADALVKAGNGLSATMCVSKLLDVEEHVWSPMYGLKGNIDATVQVTMKDKGSEQVLTVPFEVKTGKTANASHRAQTALYNLLLSDRYDIEVAYGILYYMETSETIRVPAIRHEVRHMIMQRNELACYVRQRDSHLPPMLKKESLCNRCYAKVPCFIYHRLADDGDGATSGLKEKFDDVVKHLTPTHKAFFLKWDNLLTKEENESLRFRRELWTMLSSERQKLGRCFANVIIEPGSALEEKNNPKINRFRYTLIKQATESGFSFLDSQIVVGEPIVISDEKGHFALANGYVTNVRRERVTVAVDRRLHNARIRQQGFEEKDNQVFAGIMEVTGGLVKDVDQENRLADEPVVYRLDKDEFSNGMATVRNNILQVMADGPFGSRTIRDLVVDLKMPDFKPHSTAYTLTDRANINIDQRRAIEKVMSAQDYALVLGMPGTGKTTTIAHIIRALVSQRKSVLLTSYTHTAVDNILLKLRDDGIRILRLGSAAKVHSEVQTFATLAANPQASFEDLRSTWHDSPVVATTCLGVNHPIFSERTFDYCIVDEASQITLPVCLGPIRMAKTFVLVGDHYQLPPLVQNEEARQGGLDVSLFKHLSDTHPSSVVNLEHQYRMCADVMMLSNTLIYDGRLKCGTPEVAARSINIPDVDSLRHIHHTPSTIVRSSSSICIGAVPGRCWIRDLLDPANKVRFVNTDPLLPTAREEAKGNRIVNPTEARVCVQLVESLLKVGIQPSSIGVMTHYRSQLALLRYGLRNHREIEMHTADRFQGRDKEVVILSLVRSNDAGSIGELLKDWRRINVAFTRAKTKLLVVGSRETLKCKGGDTEEMVARFVGLMEDRGWVYDLPKDALDSHAFDDNVTQASASQTGQLADDVAEWRAVAKLPTSNMSGNGNTGKGKPLQPTRNSKANNVPAKRGTVSEKVIFKGAPVLRDIANDAGLETSFF